MNKIPEIVLQSFKTDLESIERVSTNTANVTTPGFKAYLNTSSSVDNSQGELKKTSRPMDIAIDGSGWFVARNGSSMILTRNGQFHRNAEGFLSTMSGYVLQGYSGDIFVGDGKLSLGQEGQILIDDTVLDKFLISTPTNSQLEKYKNGEIQLNLSEKLNISENSVLRQSYVEQSNVQPSDSVLQMMLLNKHTQTMQKTYQTYNQIIQKTISDLGK
ncbi:hypothetical protein MHN79_06620 [Vibrio sp. Of14-4]|uniref:Uncharacterized protein n=1 Tax=Vibrio tetraodonis subsp. pristinus TaxID=2695891 RepID=A0A6L8LYS1_9VIBR|nr:MULTISPECIES: flagellar hook basal-body protein [Vibrio]MCG7489157.1 hypothetical protein [Vibrio sp. Of14-4]MYM60633.1 hypothetical protein [Vibrio tetraodonis subsp. pristinus]